MDVNVNPLLQDLKKIPQRSLKTGLILTVRVIWTCFSYTTVGFDEDIPE